EGVNEYVRRLRLESAAVALKTTERGILQIALDAGYNSHEAFTRAFRQMFAVAPSEFRAGQHPGYVHKVEPAVTCHTAIVQVRIQDIPARRLAFLRHIGPYDQVGPTFSRLMQWAWPKGLVGPGTVVLGICHDDPDVTPPDKIRYDCCIG